MPKHQLLVLGAGLSAPYLIRHLLDRAADLDASVTVGDLDGEAARRRVADHPAGRAIPFDLADAEACAREIGAADVVVSLLPPPLQPRVAKLCFEHGAHMVSASYRSAEMERLDGEARERGLTILCELGLDPGIDIMSAQRIIEDVHHRGGEIRAFASYGAGLPEPSFDGNPLRYCVTWNPRNVAMAGESGACFLEDGAMRVVPYPRLFAHRWPVDVPGLGTLEAYANRDSLSYRDIHGLDRSVIRTLIRGTLRYPGYCRFWEHLVRLGLPNEHLRVPRLGQRSFRQLMAMFLPRPVADEGLEEAVADHLGLTVDDPVMVQLDQLGFFSSDPIDIPGERLSDALVAQLGRRLPLPPGVRDMVLLHHEFEVVYSDEDRAEKILSTFVHYGDGQPGGITAMAHGVGLPAALGVELLLSGNLDRPGVVIPVTSDLYDPILDGMAGYGLSFEERVEPLPSP